MSASSLANRKARLSVLVRGARQAAYSQGLLQPVQIHCKATPQIVNRVPSCKPCSVRSECSSSERPACNRWLILSALLMALRPPSYVNFAVGATTQSQRWSAKLRTHRRVGPEEQLGQQKCVPRLTPSERGLGVPESEREDKDTQDGMKPSTRPRQTSFTF